MTLILFIYHFEELMNFMKRLLKQIDYPMSGDFIVWVVLQD